MFSELPKLLDRNFAVAYFLPAAAFCLAAWGVMTAFGLGGLAEEYLKRDVLVGGTFALVAVWLLALLLLAFNYSVLRLYEGYGAYHPLSWRKAHFRRRFSGAPSTALEIQDGIDIARARGLAPHMPRGHADQLQNAVNEFPDDGDYILPTRFGNQFRAIEVYSRIIYGLDAIPAWPRLHAVMPEHARNMIADAKAQLDFCINLSFGGWLIGLLYLVFATWYRCLPQVWLLLPVVIVGFGGYRLSGSALRNYGEYVKSAFDLYRGDLAKQLGLELPRASEAECEMWRAVSRMMIYRSHARATELTRFRPHRTNS